MFDWVIRKFRKKKPKIWIMAVAVKTGRDSMVTLPPPARHHDLIQHFKIVAQPVDQGFVTNTGLFLCRLAALKVAKNAGQIIREPVTSQHGLFSEDLW